MPPTAKPSAQRNSRAERRASGGFDADKRSERRSNEAVTINHVDYFRRVKNNAVSIEIRDVGRLQDRALRRGALARRKLEDTDLSEETKIEELEDEAYAADDEALDLMYELTRVLLRDAEGNPPSMEDLKEHVDVEDLRQINKIGQGEPLEGPTPTPTL